MVHVYHLRFSVFLLATFAAIGCGSGGLERHQVAGTVKYNGELITDGDISFTPADAATAAPPSSAPIKGGKYTLDKANGLVRGTYAVQIRAYKPSDVKELSPGGLDRPQIVGIPNRDQILPDEFNAHSTIPKVMILGDEKLQKVDFDLAPKS